MRLQLLKPVSVRSVLQAPKSMVHSAPTHLANVKATVQHQDSLQSLADVRQVRADDCVQAERRQSDVSQASARKLNVFEVMSVNQRSEACIFDDV